MKKLIVTLSISLFAGSALAWGGCKYEREIERVVKVEDAKLLMVNAGAGSLEIKGEDRNDILIKATLCSDNEKALAEMDVLSAIKSGDVSIRTQFAERSWLSGSGSQASIDLNLMVPVTLALDVKDSSGAAEISNVASLKMLDSSGELEIERVAGDVDVVDSSGRLTIQEVGGNVRVTDSSGGLYASDIEGEFLVDADSSGEIDIKNVGRSVLIKQDSSGSIKVKQVAGDFTVKADTSGGIRYDEVGGKVSLPN